MTGERPLNLANVKTTLEFATALYESEVLRPGRGSTVLMPARGIKDIKIDLTGAWKLELQDLSVLVLLVRRLAESNARVRICGPVGTSRPADARRSLLQKSGFYHAFLSAEARGDWASRVILDDTVLSQGSSVGRSYYASNRFIPFTWFDETSFIHKRDWWVDRPRVAAELSSEFRVRLTEGGYLSAEGIQTLMSTLFLEIGWNVVLHAGRQPGDGVGVFVAHIDHKHVAAGRRLSTITFSLADVGQGIPQTLREVYQKRASQIAKASACSLPSRIIQFALEPHGTRRSVMSSKSDEEGFRGLTHVADVMSARGHISIRSTGGAQVFEQAKGRGVEWTHDDELEASPLPGTQIWGTLTEPTAQQRLNKQTSRLKWSVDAAIVHVIDQRGDWRQIETERAAETFIASLSLTRPVAVFDCGFAPVDANVIQYLVKASVRRLPRHRLVFWNVRLAAELFRHLGEWVPRNLKAGQLPPVVVGAAGDAWAVGVTNIEIARAQFRAALDIGVEANELPSEMSQSAGLARARIGSEAVVEIDTLVNSSFLEDGFVRGQAAEGFYIGHIRLLNSLVANRYFALVRHAQLCSGNSERWINTITVRILALTESVDKGSEPTVLIGFAGSLRRLLVSVSEGLQQRLPHKAYTLLAYDSPTRDEMAVAVESGTRVLLLTDVLSSGRLNHSICRLIERLGGTVVASIAAVDARSAGTHLASDVLTCARLQGVIMTRDTYEDEQWVDSVSMLPTRRPRDFGALRSRMDSTLEILTSPDVVRCGHQTNGPRHLSVLVDIARLLQLRETDVRTQLVREVKSRLGDKRWADFSPTVCLFPAGLNRVEPVVVGQGDDMRFSAYESAVQLLQRLIRDAFDWRVESVEVSRLFEASGRSRCAQEIDLGPHRVGSIRDIIVIDDGMSSGGTSRELVRVAQSLGARRIVVLPCVARMSISDAMYWETISEVDTAGKRTRIRYVFPLFLPIPIYDDLRCPYEQTRRRLDRFSRDNDEASVVAKALRRSLLPDRPRSEAPHDSSYIRTWLRAHSLLEISPVDYRAMDELQVLLNHSTDHSAKLALCDLFADEWGFLGRQLVRQTIGPTIVNLCVSILSDVRAMNDLKLSALAVLRSAFAEEFVQEFPSIVSSHRAMPRVLERAVFQAFTLDAAMQTSREIQEGARLVVDNIGTSLAVAAEPSGTSQEDLECARRAFGMAGRMLVRRNEVQVAGGFRQTAHELVRLLRQDTDVKHRLHGLLQTIAGWSRIRSTTLTSPTIRHSLDDWNKERTLLDAEIRPRLARLEELWLDPDRTFLPSTLTDIRYLSTAKDIRGDLAGDVVQLGFELEYMLNVRNIETALSRAVIAAKRLLTSCLDPESAACRIIDDTHTSTIASLLNTMSARIATMLPDAETVRVDIGRSDAIADHRALFLPTHLLERLCVLCVSNIAEHAFGDSFPNNQERCVRISIEPADHVDEFDAVRVKVFDNGTGIDAPLSASESTRTLKARLKSFGGWLDDPFEADVSGWTTCIQFGLSFW